MNDREELTALLMTGAVDCLGKGGTLNCSKLADYLLEHGIIVLPCKVGDTIYQIDGVRIYASTIYEITYTENKVIFVTENVVFDERAINNSIFLTREEAEKALKERER